VKASVRVARAKNRMLKAFIVVVLKDDFSKPVISSILTKVESLD
jgi:hypothetical protein